MHSPLKGFCRISSAGASLSDQEETSAVESFRSPTSSVAFWVKMLPQRCRLRV